MKFIPDCIFDDVAKRRPDYASPLFAHLEPAKRDRLHGFAPGTGGQVVIWDAQRTNDLRKARAEDTPEVKQVRRFAESTVEYLSLVCGRNGIDGNGMNVFITLNYPMANAFWWRNQLVLGIGDGRVFKEDGFTQSIDVMAHEMAHGVVAYTSKLVYQGQSGALNEHMADVLGCVVQANHGRNDWLIGNEVMAEKGEALRSMAYPGTAYNSPVMGRDRQPDHYRNIYRGEMDNGGVHINSGVPNRLFYLVAREIGVHRAARLWYRVLLTLEPTAQFHDFANRLEELAADAPSGTPQLVRWARKEVGL